MIFLSRSKKKLRFAVVFNTLKSKISEFPVVSNTTNPSMSVFPEDDSDVIKLPSVIFFFFTVMTEALRLFYAASKQLGTCKSLTSNFSAFKTENSGGKNEL